MIEKLSKRGRPIGNGMRNPKFVPRDMWIVLTYDRSRARGEKHEVAIDEAALMVRERYGRGSRTEVKRVLSVLRPKDERFGYIFREVPLEEDEQQLNRMKQETAAADPGNRRPSDFQFVRAIEASFGRIPQCPRVNRKNRTTAVDNKG